QSAPRSAPTKAPRALPLFGVSASAGPPGLVTSRVQDCAGRSEHADDPLPHHGLIPRRRRELGPPGTVTGTPVGNRSAASVCVRAKRGSAQCRSPSCSSLGGCTGLRAKVSPPSSALRAEILSISLLALRSTVGRLVTVVNLGIMGCF